MIVGGEKNNLILQSVIVRLSASSLARQGDDSTADFPNSCFSFAVSLGGMTIFTFTYSFPRPSSRLFNACPRNLSLLPPCVEAGIFIQPCRLASVGTGMVAPSAACQGEIGTLT